MNGYRIYNADDNIIEVWEKGLSRELFKGTFDNLIETLIDSKSERISNMRVPVQYFSNLDDVTTSQLALVLHGYKDATKDIVTILLSDGHGRYLDKPLRVLKISDYKNGWHKAYMDYYNRNTR